MASISNLENYSIVLLSAGIGRRLGNLGKKKPKSLLKIGKKTLIEILINNLKKRKVKNISIKVGYKSNMIIDLLKKIKNIKINFIKIDNYKKNGHSFSWFMYKEQWFKEKKPMILFHTDIYFDPVYIDNIVNNKRKNIIGTKNNYNNEFKKNSLVVKADKKNKIKTINYISKINQPSGEIIGINKFSKKTTKKIFNFMDKFFLKKNNKFLSWELMINSYIKKNKDSLFIIKKQNYVWININTSKDYLIAKKLKFDASIN